MSKIESTAFTKKQAQNESKTFNVGAPGRMYFQGMDDLPTKTKAQRIKYVRKLNGMTQDEFGRALGTTRGAVGNWELGKGIKTENLMAIADRFHVSLGWLASERGPRPTEKTERPHIDSADVLLIDDTVPDYVESSQGISTVKPYQPKLPNASPVVSSHLGAGAGGLPQTVAIEHHGILYSADAIIGEIVLPPQIAMYLSMAPTNRIHWFEVRGDSMEPTLRGGDWVGVNTMDTGTRAGGVFALRTGNGEIIVKRISDKGEEGRIEIVSDNPQQENYFDTLDNIVIFGRVVARLSRVG